MGLARAKKMLYDIITWEFLPIEEYQDKYYFFKKMKRVFPDLSDEKIISAIDYANRETKSSRKKKKYVNALSFKMFTA
jgi:dsDNA-specific endonuclease/ATPase MutS2